MPLPAGLHHEDMTPIAHVIYLHGFASSPGSSKAASFARELARRGVAFACPDFNQPDFSTLTVTRMLEQTARAIETGPAGPVALVGSSLGAFVAVHAAAGAGPAARIAARIERLVLLAPALDFGGNRLRHLGEHGIDEWRRTGSLRVFHYADNRHHDVGFGLYEDAARYDAFAVTLTQPALVIQGTRDASVDPAMVERWAKTQSLVDLRLVDDDHQLAASTELIWRTSAQFLALDARTS